MTRIKNESRKLSNRADILAEPSKHPNYEKVAKMLFDFGGKKYDVIYDECEVCNKYIVAVKKKVGLKVRGDKKVVKPVNPFMKTKDLFDNENNVVSESKVEVKHEPKVQLNSKIAKSTNKELDNVTLVKIADVVAKMGLSEVSINIDISNTETGKKVVVSQNNGKSITLTV